jgi:hypothetical protein
MRTAEVNVNTRHMDGCGRTLVALLAIVPLGIGAEGGLKARSPATVTFTKDVAPIFYARCASCHRPNQMAPMSLLTYEEARPWAKSIRERVANREMPPWFADPAHGVFSNDARLPQTEVDTIVAWVDGGAVKGDPNDQPPVPSFPEGWTIGEPDVVLSMPEYDVPASGTIPYLYFTVPTNFTEDKWISGIEIRPGNRKVVHHVIVSVLDAAQTPPPQGATQARIDVIRSQLGGITPNKPGVMFPAGTGKLVKAGANLALQMHYTAIGEAVRDKTTIGLKFAKSAAVTPLRTGIAINMRFVIPPGVTNHEVRSSVTVNEDIRVFSFTPHMHFRGKDFTYTAVYPDGRSEILLHVPNYDFNWQLTYALQTPIALPKGTKIECVAHFDNSTANRDNPDPKAEVRWGDQTWEEMMIGFYSFTRDADRAATTAAAQR